MGVVINDFEVLPEPRGAQQRDATSAAQTEGDGGDKPDPREIEIALRDIDRRALRVWSY
jgi:hypothetical protein